MLNRKDIVDPKVEARNAHKKEVKTRLNSRFIENSKPSASWNSHALPHSQNSFAPTKILKKPSEYPSRIEPKKVDDSNRPKSRVNVNTDQNTFPRSVSSFFIAKSDGIIFEPSLSKTNVSSSKSTNAGRTYF